MIILLLIAIRLTSLVIITGRIRRLPSNKQNRAWWKFASVFLGSLLIILVITGRMHWVGALLGALLPFLRGAFSFFTQVLPLWFKHKDTILPKGKNTQETNYTNTPTQNEPMSVQQAIQLLGLAHTPSSATEIHKAHNDILQALDVTQPHAAQLIVKINNARDILLKSVAT